MMYMCSLFHQDGFSPLIWAAYLGHTDIVRLLVVQYLFLLKGGVVNGLDLADQVFYFILFYLPFL